jgi:hypothetical protein
MMPRSSLLCGSGKARDFLPYAEVQRQQANADEQRATIGRELSLIDDAYAECDREEEGWAQASSAEVIDLA